MIKLLIRLLRMRLGIAAVAALVCTPLCAQAPGGIHITNTGAIWIFFACLAALMVYLSGREKRQQVAAIAPDCPVEQRPTEQRLSDRDTLLVKLAIVGAILALIC